jgi:hypothetical protein
LRPLSSDECRRVTFESHLRLGGRLCARLPAAATGGPDRAGKSIAEQHAGRRQQQAQQRECHQYWQQAQAVQFGN